MGDDLKAVLARQAALFRALADNTDALAEYLVVTPREPERQDEALTLVQAATLVGEPPETFRRRVEFYKARISRPGEHRLRFSRRAVERVLADRLAANEVPR